MFRKFSLAGNYCRVLFTFLKSGALWLALVAVLLSGTAGSNAAPEATPGLPFIEDFTDTTLRDAAQTTANWSTEEQALMLAWQERHYGAFGAGLAGTDISSDEHATEAIALGDVDGDGDLDLVVGNYDQQNWLYTNDGAGDPWDTTIPLNITPANENTTAIALGDVDGDGDLDLVEGNWLAWNRLYLNDGVGDPWDFADVELISTDTHHTRSMVLGDVDGDGDLDLVTGGDFGAFLYLNDGEGDPWDTVTSGAPSPPAHTITYERP